MYSKSGEGMKKIFEVALFFALPVFTILLIIVGGAIKTLSVLGLIK